MHLTALPDLEPRLQALSLPCQILMVGPKKYSRQFPRQLPTSFFSRGASLCLC